MSYLFGFRSKKDVFGFSLIEVVVAFGLSSLVIIFLAMSQFSTSSILKTDENKGKLDFAQNEIKRLLDKDLESAVRVTGASAKNYPGIWTINSAGNPASADDTPVGLAILVSRYEHYSLPIQVNKSSEDPNHMIITSYYTPDGRGNLLDPRGVDSGSIPFLEAAGDNLIAKAQKSNLLYLKAGGVSEIVEYLDGTFVVGTYRKGRSDTKEYVESITVNRKFNPDTRRGFLFSYSINWESDFSENQMINLSVVHLVEWVYDATHKQLIRRVKDGIKGAEVSKEIIAKNVSNFDFLFQFNPARRLDGAEDIVSTEDWLKHPEDPDYLTGCQQGKCINWTDLQSLRVSYDIEGASSDGSQVLANSLTQSFFPERFHISFNEVQESQGIDISCNVRDPNNSRCKASCSHKFTNPSRDALDWVGYGRHKGHEDGASAYCLCGTTGESDFIPPETVEGYEAVARFANADTEEKNRLLMCIEHFDVTTPQSPWRWKHPLGRLIPDKFNSSFRNEIYSKAPDDDVHLRTKIIDLSAIEAWAQAYIAGRGDLEAEWTSKLNCRLDPAIHGDPQAHEWFSEIGLVWEDPEDTDGNGVRYRPWSEYCNCNGAAFRNTNRNWSCNHGIAQTTDAATNAAAALCPNTWATDLENEGVVELGTGGTATGKKVYNLAPEEALQCQCLADVYAGLPIPRSDGHGFSNFWDFRALDATSPITAGAPVGPTSTTPVGHIYQNPGSVVQMQTTAFYNDNGASNLINGTCQSAPIINVCISAEHTCAGRFPEDATRRAECYSVIAPAYKPEAQGGDGSTTNDYSSYCHSSCGSYSIASVRTNLQANLQLQTIRDTITAGADETNVNLYCPDLGGAPTASTTAGM